MKPQDILFILVLAGLVWKRNPKWLVSAGVLCLFLAMPLFAKWIFFTAERLVWYGAGFFLVAIILFIVKLRRGKSS